MTRQRAMTPKWPKWEYLVLSVPVMVTTSQLDAYGRTGWEMVGAFAAGRDGKVIYLIFKRPTLGPVAEEGRKA